MPGELHKLWQAGAPSSYHLEYGFSCMGYEIAGGIGIKMAQPDREVVVMVGDGSYLMMNSEIATSVMLGMKLTIVLLDNRGYRLHQPPAAGDRRRALQQPLRPTRCTRPCPTSISPPMRRSLGAIAEKVASLADLETRAEEGQRATTAPRVIVIDTDPMISTDAGGHWWDVAVPEVSTRKEVRAARKNYEARAASMQRVGELAAKENTS